ncbi:L-xylulose reductase-like [Oscarella lobularis]|uniref:L-xylulose reductase-like n=1 Tax=Oscarella lobularis TaxID=121494 RepID=UPI00331384E2
MEIRFDGKRALVTGSGKGIGREVAIALEKCGAEVYALSRTQSDLDSLQKQHPGIHAIQADVTNTQETMERVRSLGPIHLLVNNAGVGVLQPFLDVTEEAYGRVMDVNLKACLFVGQVVARGMVERGEGGAIVNVSSQASMAALRDHAVYCASKGALDQLTRVMALELGPHRIRVNCVNPTVVMTDMGRLGWSDPKKAQPMLGKIPLKRFAEVEEVVHAILYLLSDKSSMITGTMLPVDGGFLAC